MNVRSLSMCSKTCSKKHKEDSRDQHRSGKLLTKVILEILAKKKKAECQTCPSTGVSTLTALWTDAGRVVGQNPDEAELSQQKRKPELLSADTSGWTRSPITNLNEWRKNKAVTVVPSSVWSPVTDGRFPMSLLVAPTQVESQRSDLPLISFFFCCSGEPLWQLS